MSNAQCFHVYAQKWHISNVKCQVLDRHSIYGNLASPRKMVSTPQKWLLLGKWVFPGKWLLPMSLPETFSWKIWQILHEFTTYVLMTRLCRQALLQMLHVFLVNVLVVLCLGRFPFVPTLLSHKQFQVCVRQNLYYIYLMNTQCLWWDSICLSKFLLLSNDLSHFSQGYWLFS